MECKDCGATWGVLVDVEDYELCVDCYDKREGSEV